MTRVIRDDSGAGAAYPAGQAESVAGKLAETPVHDHAKWERQRADADQRARESLAKAEASRRGQR